MVDVFATEEEDWGDCNSRSERKRLAGLGWREAIWYTVDMRLADSVCVPGSSVCLNFVAKSFTSTSAFIRLKASGFLGYVAALCHALQDA